MKTWRRDLAGVIILAAVAFAADAHETQVPPEETQVQETHVPDYKAVWEWCGVRFPYREDLQEACRWGAYKMLPGQSAPTEEGVKDA